MRRHKLKNRLKFYALVIIAGALIMFINWIITNVQ